MSYEIKFHFHERDEIEGKYNTDESKTLTRIVGKRTEDVPLEQVAAVILGQLARRDIWVVDVEIAEFARRPVSFKETKSGVIIKNKKFHYDQVAGHLISEDEDKPIQQHQQPQQQQVLQTQPIRPKRDPNVPLRYEVFHPGREDYGQLQREGVKLSMGKPYPIFGENVKMVQGPYGGVETLYYVVQDDSGQKIDISGMFFEPMSRGLSFTGMQGMPSMKIPEGKLSYVDTAPMSTGSDNLDALIAKQDAALLRRG